MLDYLKQFLDSEKNKLVTYDLMAAKLKEHFTIEKPFCHGVIHNMLKEINYTYKKAMK